MRLAQGGKFEQGFLSGFISSLCGSYIQANGANMTGVEKIAISAAIGGTAEVLGGGKFANGAVTGAYVMALNHMGHGNDSGDNEKVENYHKETQREVLGYSIDLTLTVPFGFTLEFGQLINPVTGEIHYFTTYGLAFGVEQSFGVNSILIKPQSNFIFSDLAGSGGGISLSNPAFSLGGFTNSKPAYPVHQYFRSYKAVKVGVGFSGFGASYQPATTTNLIKAPTILKPPPTSIFNSNP